MMMMTMVVQIPALKVSTADMIYYRVAPKNGTIFVRLYHILTDFQNYFTVRIRNV